VAQVRIFKHYIHLPFVLIGLLDALVLAVAFSVSVFFLFFMDWTLFQDNMSAFTGDAVIYLSVNLAAMLSLGVYQAKIEEGMIGMMLRTIFSVIISVVVLSAFFYLFSNYFFYFGKGVLTQSSVFSIFLLGISRVIFFFCTKGGVFEKRVIVLGAGLRAKNLILDLANPIDKKGFSIIGYVPMPGEKTEVDEKLLIHLPTTLYHYINHHSVDEIVVLLDDRRKNLPLDDLLQCKMAGIDIIDGPNFIERESRKVALEMIQPSWIIFSDGFGGSSFNQFIKRTFDLLVSFLFLLLTWPFMLLTVVSIKIEEGLTAPAIYRQERVGLNGKLFFIYKFRSMRVDAEKKGEAIWAKKNDTRVTVVGEFIRKVRIDELPQIFNVLKGDMAFVGPRPERPVFVKQLSERIPYYSERHRAKPGITGWAQLCFAYADSEEDSKEKLRYDLYYIKNQSFLLDCIILLQTVEVVLFKKGSR